MNKLLILSLTLLLFSCKKEDKVEEEVAKIPIQFKVERFDKIFYESKPEDLAKIKAQYPFFFPEGNEDSVWTNKLNNPLLRDVYRESPKRQQEFIALLNPGVLKNFQESNRFWETYQNPLSPYFESIFNRFLKMNNQAQGVKSYGQIVQLLLAYHAQYPL